MPLHAADRRDPVRGPTACGPLDDLDDALWRTLQDADAIIFGTPT